MHLRNRDVGGKKTASRRPRPDSKYRVQRVLRPKAKPTDFIPMPNRYPTTSKSPDPQIESDRTTQWVAQAEENENLSPEGSGDAGSEEDKEISQEEDCDTSFEDGGVCLSEGDGAAPTEANWGNTIPEPTDQQDQSSPLQQYWGLDATSLTPGIPPPNTDFYPQSGFAWSYEVETDNHIFRISTIPNDFLGNSGQDDWPRVLKACHTDYKNVSQRRETAEWVLMKTRDPDLEPLELEKLLAEVFYAALDEVKVREDFLQVWPSAFGWDAGYKGHINWSRKMEKLARDVQKEGLDIHLQLHGKAPKERGHWLTKSVDESKTKSIHAMCPAQYEELYRTVNQKKKDLYGKAKGSWASHVHPPRTISLPNLPPPRSGRGFPLPNHTDKEKRECRLPDHVFLDILLHPNTDSF